MPGAEWYVVVGDNEQGPFTAQQLKQFADQGKLRPEMQVRKEGMDQHVQAQAIKGLFPAAGAAAPQPAPAPAQQAPPQPQPQPEALPPPPEEDIPPPEEVPVGTEEEPAAEPAPAQAGSGRRSRRGRGTGDGGAGGRSRRTGGGGARSRRGGGRGSRRRGGGGDDEDPRRAKKKGGLNPLIIVAIAVVVLGGAGAGLYFGGFLGGGGGASLDGTWNLDVDPILEAMEKEAGDDPGTAMGLGMMRMVMGPLKIMDIVVNGNQVHIPDPNSGEVKTAKLEILSRDGNKFKLKLHPPPDQEGEGPVEFSVTLKGDRASIDPPEDVAAKMKQSGVPMDLLGFTRKSTSTAKPKVPSKEELQEAMGGGLGGLGGGDVEIEITPPEGSETEIEITPPDGAEEEEGAPAIPDGGTGE